MKNILITMFMMMHNAVYGTGVVHVSCSSRVTLLYLVGLGQFLPTVVAQQYPRVDPILQHEGQSHPECNHVCVGSREKWGRTWDGKRERREKRK